MDRRPNPQPPSPRDPVGGSASALALSPAESPSPQGRPAAAAAGVRASAPSSGSVLILALWALAFLGALAVAVSAIVSASVETARAVRAATAGRHAVRAEIETALAEALEQTNSMGHAAGCWNTDPAVFRGALDFGDGQAGAFRVFYTYHDASGNCVTNDGVTCESARINVNRLSDRSVRAMFGHLVRIQGGLDTLAAEQLVSAIRDWTDADDDETDAMLTGGSESGYYATRTPSYGCHNGPLDSAEELLLVRGMTPELFDAIAPYITVYGRGEKVHVNMAALPVLRCAALAAGIDEGQAAALAAALVKARPRDDLDGFEDVFGKSGPLRNVRRYLTTRAESWRGTAEGGTANGAPGTRVDFVYDSRRNAIVMWRE
jgi:general secretion pathway protein K